MRMTDLKRRALISVSDKSGLVPFAAALAELGFELIATAGTARALAEAGLPVTQVSALTGYPELLGGRVKTLHPAVAAAVLAGGPEHLAELAGHGIRPIDLVVVTLYPFEAAAARGERLEDLVEWIDVGGVTLLRAAAKNWQRVGAVCDPTQYVPVQKELARSGALSEKTRRELAARAFARVAAYDAAIAARLAGEEAFPDPLVLVYWRRALLRYGENPHQQAALYTVQAPPPGEVAGAELLQGKPLSYNNLADLDAAWAAVRELTPPAAVVVKHATPCGAALGATAADAVRRAIAADATSAFGGILAVNAPLDPAVVEAMGSLFLEAVIAPQVTEGARRRLDGRRNLRVLQATTGSLPPAGLPPARVVRSLPGGLLVQDADATGLPREETVVTRRAPTPEELADLRFAWLVCKHVRSNAIVLAAAGQTVGVGGGQTSRVDGVRLAVARAGVRARGSVLASDGFFPFADGLEEAAAAGVTAVIQPGGSVRDREVVAAADAHGLAMVFTGERHFRH